ncbi:Vegetative incompatibility protein HET-E-1 [Apiospora phragmitis]|uniref:Vegetative incompatibility protein HET-E-1 n=1 Tax=Apiospora phragmitis TaxID=2905665 RepID=A0ABR1VPP6_9PEZI
MRTNSLSPCKDICQTLIGEIAKLEKGIAKKSKASAAKLSLKVIWKKSVGDWKLDGLEKQLQEAKDLVQLSLINHTCAQVTAMHADLSVLSPELRSVAEKWGDGQRELSELFSKEATTIKVHVTTTAIQARAAQEEQARKDAQAEQRRKLLQSLIYNGMNERRNNHPVHHPSTLQTIWNDDVDTGLWNPFRDWLPSEDQVFWVSGRPGSGKTTLMKFLVLQPQTWERLRAWSPDVIVVSHFIWLLGPDPLQRNLKGLFCYVIHQVLGDSPAIADRILAASEALSLKNNYTDWSLEELKEYLFLDGLDDIDPKDGTDTLLDALAGNFRPFPHVKLCMASRPEPILRTRFEQANYSKLALHDANHQDITRYIESALKCEGDNKHTLKALLITKAHGVFLWAHLVLRNVNRALELSQEFNEARRYIVSLPEGLADLYKSMWERMSRDER